MLLWYDWLESNFGDRAAASGCSASSSATSQMRASRTSAPQDANKRGRCAASVTAACRYKYTNLASKDVRRRDAFHDVARQAQG